MMEPLSSNIYVFLSHPAFGIGGAQLYVRDKSLYLRKRGYKVILFSSNNGENLIIKEFASLEMHTFPQLVNKPIIYSKRKRERIVNSLVQIIGMQNNVVIESCDVNSGAWGELLAQKLNARNVIFCLAETFPVFSNSEYDFLHFKHNRKELFGIHKSTLSSLFKEEIEEKKQYSWRAICDNRPVDVSNVVLDRMEKCDYNIGSIGRIDKPYLPKMLEGIASFAKNHPTNSINVILCVGEHTMEQEVGIRGYFESVANISLYIFGPLIPLPASLFKICDVFVSSAGCAGISLGMDIPTITLDVRDYDPIGVLGFTTQNTLYRTDEEKRDLEFWLEDILVNRCCKDVILQKNKPDIDNVYCNQLSDIIESNQSLSYYNVNAMHLSSRNMMRKIIMMFGEKTYKKCKSILKMQ